MSKKFRVNDILSTFGQYFSLGDDKVNEEDVIRSIRKGTEFTGTNLWILVSAIVLASIGLNVNSTAVIIGAMLISPLIGPIMGIGLGVGIYDFELIKKAGRNLFVAVFFSVAASTIYFLLSPLTEAHSELLARTSPTVWDVLIALFGGLAGIIVSSSKEKGSVIPGVAIATALMPPLCTAGYGIANGNILFFVGAIYLFFINSVFICLATFLIVRFLKFQPHVFVNKVIETKIKRYVTIIVIATTIPSLYMAYRIANRSIFEQNARKFVQSELGFAQTQVINKNFEQKGDTKIIDVTLMGKLVDSILIENAREKLANYKLNDTKLIVRQSAYNNANDITRIKSGIIEELFKKNDLVVKTKDEKIAFLENELLNYEQNRLPVKEITKEALAEHPNITEFSINRNVLYKAIGDKYDTVFVVYIDFKNGPAEGEIKRINAWLKVRVNSDKIKLIIK